jgi:hypothetical protein
VKLTFTTTINFTPMLDPNNNPQSSFQQNNPGIGIEVLEHEIGHYKQIENVIKGKFSYTATDPELNTSTSDGIVQKTYNNMTIDMITVNIINDYGELRKKKIAELKQKMRDSGKSVAEYVKQELAIRKSIDSARTAELGKLFRFVILETYKKIEAMENPDAEEDANNRATQSLGRPLKYNSQNPPIGTDYKPLTE